MSDELIGKLRAFAPYADAYWSLPVRAAAAENSMEPRHD